MAEEFYTLTGLPVVTPSNFDVWLEAVKTIDKDGRRRLEFQEIMSGNRMALNKLQHVFLDGWLPGRPPLRMGCFT